MFNFNTKRETINKISEIIDEEIAEREKTRNEFYSELKGYAEAHDKWYVQSYVGRIAEIEGGIEALEQLKLLIEYRV